VHDFPVFRPDRKVRRGGGVLGFQPEKGQIVFQLAPPARAAGRPVAGGVC